MQNFFQKTNNDGFEITITKSVVGQSPKKRIYYVEQKDNEFIMHDVSGARIQLNELLSREQILSYISAIQSNLIDIELKDKGQNNAEQNKKTS